MRKDFAIRFMMKTGDLGRALLKQFSRLQKERRDSRLELKPSLFFPL
jgi:hypothetical protein